MQAHFSPVAIVVNIVVIATGLVCCALSLRLRTGIPAHPGPGLWPLIVAGFMVLCGLWLLLTERSGQDYERLGHGIWPAVAGLAALIAFAFVLETLGMLLSTALLMLFWLKILGRQGWMTSVTVSVLGPAGAFVLFVMVLAIPMPVWPLGIS